MRFAIFLAAIVAMRFALGAPVGAQERPDRPQAAFAGQALGGIACDPDGSTITMSACYQLWLTQEEELLRGSAERLLSYARQREAQSTLLQGDLGYVGSITRGQGGWLQWRDNECALATLDAVSGSIRNLSYPNCQARLTAQRRQQLDALLALWQSEFRDADDKIRPAVCALHADVNPYCRE